MTAGALGQFDMDAVRVLDPEPGGLEALLRQAWARYGLPLAVTESHLNGPLDDRMRWLWESWTTMLRLQAEGVDVRAVTCWSLLGSYDWDSLLTRDAGSYEAGPFDLTRGRPEATEMTGLLRRLAAGEGPHDVIADYPMLAAPAGGGRRRG